MSLPERKKNPSFIAALIVSGLVVLLIAYVRLVLLRGKIFPLADALPLLVCLWHRDKKILLGMGISFSLIVLAKILWVVPIASIHEIRDATTIVMLYLNIWLSVLAVYAILSREEVLGKKNDALNRLNVELAGREGELVLQNEELLAQSEALEQQTEELRQQSIELERSNERLEQLSQELKRRENVLQSLFDLTHWQADEVVNPQTISMICEAAVRLMENHASAAAIFEQNGSELQLIGDFGFNFDDTNRPTSNLSQSLASIVIEKQKTAYIKNISLRPDLNELRRPGAPPFTSVLAAPLILNTKPIGAIAVFCDQQSDWSEEQFNLLEWLAAQASLVINVLKRKAELETRKAEAEEASVKKTRFLAAVSHDIRTPVNAISLIADLISRNASDPLKVNRIPQMAKELKASARSLIELVSDVLDLTRFDSGKVELTISRFSLLELLQIEVDRIRLFAQEKGLKIIFEPGADVIYLMTDKVKLARVIGNLLSNAVKFTDKGSVALMVSGGPDGATILIKDTGEGIPFEKLESIFDEFYQINNPERDRQKGTGLGLAICKRLMDGLGGAISVQSAVGSGSIFTVTLPSNLIALSPVAKKGPDATRTGDNATLGRFLAGYKIILIEDHDFTRRATAELLSSEGALVYQAATGKQALSALLHEQVDAVILDLMLPDMDGIEVLQSIQRNRPASLKTILVVSGDVSPDREAGVKLFGADALMQKPISIEDITKMLLSAFKTKVSTSRSV